jgi:ubiquinone/menaquinone biosynthesis C-methylase UbiE
MGTTTSVYTSKAEKYARYRWDYAPEAIQVLCEITGANSQTTAADIGAGTGILTRHFAARVRRVYALEPNLEMRLLAERSLSGSPACMVVGAAAEALPLADHCIDLLTAGQAVHWFEPEPARAEFRRVLKPGGWLAFISNRGSDPVLGSALAELQTTENGAQADRPAAPGLTTPPAFYISAMRVFAFPFREAQNWEAFIGSLLSASYMPAEDSPAYPGLERAARQVFSKFSRAGLLEVNGVTDLVIGQASA